MRLLYSLFFLLSPITGMASLVLEQSDVFHLKSSIQVTSDGELLVQISGLAGHSSYVVKGYNFTRINEREQLLVINLIPAKEGFSGGFKIPLRVGKNDERILFGEKRSVIWQKDDTTHETTR